MTYRSERLAYWYFRLNGFLTTENFVVHPEQGSDQRTDADLLCVRFLHRVENSPEIMVDDPRVADCALLTNIIIAEVKTGRCALNESWTNQERGNLPRILRAIGCVGTEEFSDVIRVLYQSGLWAGNDLQVRLFGVGEDKSQLLIPPEQQLTWDEIIDFIVKRFQEFVRQKASVGQWTEDGRKLRSLAVDGDIAGIRALFRLSNTSQTPPILATPESNDQNRGVVVC